MNDPAIFYRCTLEPSEGGLIVLTTVFESVRETPCLFLCVQQREASYARSLGFPFQKINERFKVRRIHKSGSRVAQPTIAEALESLKRRKRHQIGHASREIEVAQAFLDNVEGVEPDPYTRTRVPGTEETCRQLYVFD